MQLELAVGYARLGWKLIPIHNMQGGRCSCEDKEECRKIAKHPRIKNWVDDASSDTQRITDWWTQWPYANIGLLCGARSGVFAIDIDPRNGGFEAMDAYETRRPDGPLPTTLIASTGGGGRHLFYRYPPDRRVAKKTNWLTGVDIQAEGSYVILPESTHSSGGQYRWINWENNGPLSLALAPSDLLLSILTTSADNSTRSDNATSLEADLILQGITEGARNDTLFKFACSFRRKNGDGSKESLRVILYTAADNCTPAFPHNEVNTIIDSAWKMDHSDTSMTWVMGTGESRQLTDHGNALRFVDLNSEDVKYVPAWGWLVWGDTGWRRDDEMEVQRRARALHEAIVREGMTLEDQREQTRYARWAVTSQSAGKLEAIHLVARSDSRIIESPQSFDTDPMVIACRNGTVNLATGKLISLGRGDLVTRNTNVIYDPTADTDRWLTFLKQSLGNDPDVLDYIQKCAGYTLTGSTRDEKFFIISGPQASGKSTFLDGMAAAMGMYGVSTPSETIMYHHNKVNASQNELAGFVGIRLLLVSEVREGAAFHESLLKSLTGGDQMTGKFLYKEPFTFVPQLKLWIATNHDPQVRDDAVFRRLRKVPFPNTVPMDKRDRDLKHYLRDPEAGGREVLKWMIDGARKWMAEGISRDPLAIQMATDDYYTNQDQDGRFISDVLAPEIGCRSSFKHLYEEYKRWCAENEERPKRPPLFRSMLQNRGVKVVRETVDLVVFDYRVKMSTIGIGGYSWS